MNSSPDVVFCCYRIANRCTILKHVVTSADILIGGGSTGEDPECGIFDAGDGSMPGTRICPQISLFSSNIPPDTESDPPYLFI